MMLQAGESPLWVAKQIGHTDWSFTARTYSRYIPDQDNQAGNKAVEMFNEQDLQGRNLRVNIAKPREERAPRRDGGGGRGGYGGGGGGRERY